MQLKTLLKAINIADMEGVKTLSVDIQDLRLLRREIYMLKSSNDNLKKEVHILDAKLSLKALDAPVKLNCYA